MADDDGRVRGRAYSIWEAEGRPAGKDLEHWLQAEREAAEETLPPDSLPPEDGAIDEAPEARLADVIERDEAAGPTVEGAATLVDAD